MAQQLGLLDGLHDYALETLSLDLAIRESRRARRLILQVVPPFKLELVVPRGTRPKEIELFLGEHRAWLDQARAEIDAEYKAARNGRPSAIELPSIDASIEVAYSRGAGTRAGFRYARNRLEIESVKPDGGDAPELLRQWLLAMGRRHLKPWLLREARVVGARPSQVQVRLQRTRWGSCSARGTISLNASLLLLEPPLVRYLMIHELCHLRELNHSPRYWAAVERFEPDYRRLDSALAKSWTRVPYWVFPA